MQIYNCGFVEVTQFIVISLGGQLVDPPLVTPANVVGGTDKYELKFTCSYITCIAVEVV